MVAYRLHSGDIWEGIYFVMTEQERQIELAKLIEEQRKDMNSRHVSRPKKEITMNPQVMDKMFTKNYRQSIDDDLMDYCDDRGLKYDDYNGFVRDDA